ncbi:MAG TPA: type II secretion system F family protein [Candidatus Sulfotelmatobacter sp.]|jgi:tight adherence protein C|nr:type II secretion system F family protein [Candidatus Sulfotelmatobacter sp.]
MALVLAILIFIAVALAVFAFLAAAYAPSSVLGARLRSLSWQRPQREKPAIKERFEQALDPLSKALPLSPTDTNRTRGWLIQAGYRESRHLTLFQGTRVLFAAIGFVSVLAISGLNSPPLLIGVTALGFFIPRFFLKRMITDRQSRIRVGMPDALDLTVICVEAGLSLDQAMMRVGEDLRHAHPDLSDEFYLMNLELRAGKPRAEALRNLYNRTGVDDIKALVTTLVQTDRFGTSIAQALRVHSDSLRTERRQRAEEQAAKTTIKMVPPLVVFVLPSIIIVTLGPAIIQLYRTLVS